MSTTHDNGGPAFPMIRDMRHRPDWDHEEGMTLRDYFAAAALQGMLANPNTDYSPEEYVTVAYNLASRMVARRK